MTPLPNPPLNLPERQRGFTLVELMVGIALLAILTTLAIPSFTETLRQWRRDSATRALTASLQLARSEAVKSSRRVVACSSSTGTSCANSSEWKTGWILFVDDGAGTSANANNQVVDADERVISVVPEQQGIASLTASGDTQFLQFLSNGLLLSANDLTFTVTPDGANASTKVNKIGVSMVGRTSVKTELP